MDYQINGIVQLSGVGLVPAMTFKVQVSQKGIHIAETMTNTKGRFNLSFSLPDNTITSKLVLQARTSDAKQVIAEHWITQMSGQLDVLLLSFDNTDRASHKVNGKFYYRDGSSFNTQGNSILMYEEVSPGHLALLAPNVITLPDGVSSYNLNYAWQAQPGVQLTGPKLLVRLFDSQGKSIAEGRIDEASVDTRLDMSIANPVVAPTSFVIRGVLRNTDTAGVLPNIKVEAAFLKEGGARLLHQTATSNDKGEFSIPFDSTVFANLATGQKMTVKFTLIDADNRALEQVTPDAIENLTPADQQIEIYARLAHPLEEEPTHTGCIPILHRGLRLR